MPRTFEERVTAAKQLLTKGGGESGPLAFRWETIARTMAENSLPDRAAQAWELAACLHDRARRFHTTKTCAKKAVEAWLRAGSSDRAATLLARFSRCFEPLSRAVLRAKILRATGEPESALSELADYADAPVFVLRAAIKRDLGRDERCLEDLARAMAHRLRHGDPIDRLRAQFQDLAREHNLELEARQILDRALDSFAVNDLRRRPRRGK
jgi:hypothetical protein